MQSIGTLIDGLSLLVVERRERGTNGGPVCILVPLGQEVLQGGDDGKRREQGAKIGGPLLRDRAGAG